MEKYLYLSLIPESLVASMLPPEEFGAYLATGTRKRPHGEAMFFQLKRDLESDYFELSDVDKRCVPHPDGQPKHSVYLAIYRVLENVPLDAIESLWLITAHGRALELVQRELPPPPRENYHLYQELCPVHPLIASSLSPDKFCRLITDTRKPISVPRICFVELQLGCLTDDPSSGGSLDLPYHNIDHIRACLNELRADTGKQTKTVNRISQQVIIYRCVKGGFFVGDGEKMVHYPYPTREELESEHYAWWRCANDTEIEHVMHGA